MLYGIAKNFSEVVSLLCGINWNQGVWKSFASFSDWTLLFLSEAQYLAKIEQRRIKQGSLHRTA